VTDTNLGWPNVGWPEWWPQRPSFFTDDMRAEQLDLALESLAGAASYHQAWVDAAVVARARLTAERRSIGGDQP
jgi:hypothetical protein